MIPRSLIAFIRVLCGHIWTGEWPLFAQIKCAGLYSIVIARNGYLSLASKMVMKSVCQSLDSPGESVPLNQIQVDNKNGKTRGLTKQKRPKGERSKQITSYTHQRVLRWRSSRGYILRPCLVFLRRQITNISNRPGCIPWISSVCHQMKRRRISTNLFNRLT